MTTQGSYAKTRAIQMRKKGASVRDIEKRLTIARSTLSFWFKDVRLSRYHLRQLKRRADKSLIRARKEAVKWHHAQKIERLREAYSGANQTLSRVDYADNLTLELMLAMLYLAEGSKKNSQTLMGNSDPLILNFFVRSIHRLYAVPITAFKCNLHLRADQNPRKMQLFWARSLGIPSKNFGKPLIDKRTMGSATYPHYKGVCAVSCSRVAIQRKLMYIATAYCENSVGTRAVSSVGRARR